MKTTRVVKCAVLGAALIAIPYGVVAQESWRLLLGLGAMRAPEHTGSESYEWGICPFVKADVSVGRIRVYAEGTEIGVRATGIGGTPCSLVAGITLGEGRGAFENPARGFAGLDIGSEHLYVSGRVLYAPYWVDGSFGGHGVLPEVSVTARKVSLPFVLSGTVALLAMNDAWANAYYGSFGDVMQASVSGNALLFVSRRGGLFVGGDVARFLGSAQRSAMTARELESSVRFGCFAMLGDRP